MMPPPRGEGHCSGAAPHLHRLSFVLQRIDHIAWPSAHSKGLPFRMDCTLDGNHFQKAMSCAFEILTRHLHIFFRSLTCDPFCLTTLHAPGAKTAGDGVEQSQLAGN